MRRITAARVKRLRSYTAHDLAECCGVHKNTVRNWQREGLAPIDHIRPLLFQGADVRAFLDARNAKQKQPCKPGTIYCFGCREPSRPAAGTVQYVPMTAVGGNLRAQCTSCGTTMHRRVRKAEISKVLPDCTVEVSEGQARLSGKADPSLNCVFKKRG
jgi:hypothetical protein